MNKILYKHLQRAIAEHRVCVRCGWIVTKINWKKGHRLCSGCRSATEAWLGVGGHYQPLQEVPDKTGEML